MASELKPCPFCGSTRIDWNYNDTGLKCYQCKIKGPSGEGDGLAQIQASAIQRWNHRGGASEQESGRSK